MVEHYFQLGKGGLGEPLTNRVRDALYLLLATQYPLLAERTTYHLVLTTYYVQRTTGA